MNDLLEFTRSISSLSTDQSLPARPSHDGEGASLVTSVSWPTPDKHPLRSLSAVVPVPFSSLRTLETWSPLCRMLMELVAGSFSMDGTVPAAHRSPSAAVPYRPTPAPSATSVHPSSIAPGLAATIPAAQPLTPCRLFWLTLRPRPSPILLIKQQPDPALLPARPWITTVSQGPDSPPAKPIHPAASLPVPLAASSGVCRWKWPAHPHN